MANLLDQLSVEALVRPGEVLAGKYRIERILGAGGMGVVVAATHLKLDETVAIKFLLPDAVTQPESVARFEREARAAVKIKSEHVARVIDVGTLESGSPYIVMEHLEGSDLAAVVKARRTLPIEDAVEYVLQACEAIAEAHAIGIIHRDLKPNNLFLTRRADGSPSIKVLDFGISKLMPGSSSSEKQASMTTTDSLLGSPIYMSPEQMTAPRGVDARADIWALGATLFKLVTGKAAFEGDSIPQICGMILMGTPPRSLRSLLPGAPPELEAVISRCMTREPDGRFANISDLAQALAPFGPPRAQRSADRVQRVMEAAGIPSSVPVPPPAPSITTLRGDASASDISERTSAAPAARTLATWSTTASARRSRSRGILVFSAAALVLGVGVVLGLGMRRDPVALPPSSAAEPAPPAVPAAPEPAAPAPAPTAQAEAPAPPASAAAPVATTAAPRGRVPVRPVGKAVPAPAAPPPATTPAPATPPKKKSGYFFDERL